MGLVDMVAGLNGTFIGNVVADLPIRDILKLTLDDLRQF